MRGVVAVCLAALVAASLARPAPVPPAKPGALTPAQKKLADEVWLPPWGLFDAKKDKPKPPGPGKTDLTRYAEPTDEPDGLRNALHEARVVLWATSPAPPPKALAKQVEALRKKMKLTTARPPTRVTAAEDAKGRPALQRRLKEAGTQIARSLARLETAAELLQTTDSTDQPARVRAQHTYLTAALLSRAVHLDEHQGALGQMRKEAPPRGDDDIAWELRRTERLSDAASRRRYKQAVALWQRLIKEHPGTVWEALAREALKAPLGVQWEAVR